ncbi:MAG: signal peptidase II [Rhodospirillaceae bacterium]
MMPTARRLALGLGLAIVVVLLDQASKGYVIDLLTPPPHAVILTDWLNLVMTWNHGISFGLFSGQAGPYIFVAVALAVSAGLVVWMVRDRRLGAALWLGLVIGGAIGNVIDRVRLGAVADFIDVHAGTWHWPAFNIADSAITLGVALILIDGLFSRPEMS